jgi:RHS repeat-associated protein
VTVTSTVSLDTTTARPIYNYSYDSMYRLNGMTTGSTTVVNGVSYNAANQLLGMTFNGYTETCSYNSLNQLTNLTSCATSCIYEAGGVSLTYNYPSGTNNGKLSSMYNAISGETVTYTYDSLNRLATATGSGWGETYGFDGFGNLLSKTVTSGSGPSLSQTVNPANNQIGYSYDANGNQESIYNGTSPYDLTYDPENRQIGVYSQAGQVATYFYDAQNRRIFSWATGTTDSWGNTTNYTVNIYTPTGQKLGAYTLAPNLYEYEGAYTPFMSVTLSSSDQYFGARRLAPMDQLGSAALNGSGFAQSFYPWGENRGTNIPQNTWGFATYWADSLTGLNYAMNRYYSSSYGRFMTPDPYRKSGNRRNPQSWNRYAYVLGDPVNRNDPKGLCTDYNEVYAGPENTLGALLVAEDDEQCVCIGDGCDDSDDPQLEYIADFADSLEIVNDINSLNPQGFINFAIALDALGGVSESVGMIAATMDAAAAFDAGANAIMLGPQGYVEIAGSVGANALSFTPAEWEAMTAPEQQQAMMGFINQALAYGQQIIFDINPATAAAAGNAGTAFEYDYITQTRGLQVVQEGTSWVVAP